MSNCLLFVDSKLNIGFYKAYTVTLMLMMMMTTRKADQFSLKNPINPGKIAAGYGAGGTELICKMQIRLS